MENQLSTTPQQAGSPNRNNQTMETLVNTLFEKLKANRPAWRQAFPSTGELELVKKQWAIAFQEESINTIELVNAGLKAIRSTPGQFFPSVGEFINLARQQFARDAGLPTEDNAYQIINKVMAVRFGARYWDKYHPAIHWAFCQLDWINFNQRKEDDQRKIFSGVWRQVMARAGQGFEFPPVAKALPKETVTLTRNKRVGMEALSNLKSMFPEENQDEIANA